MVSTHPRYAAFFRISSTGFGYISVFELLHRRYDPVMKFVPAEEPGHYAVHRMTYRGEGGWSWPLTIGPLQKLLKKYLKHVGTEEFFELM